MAIDKRKIIRGRDPNNKKTIRIEKQIEEFVEKEEYLSEYYDKVKPLEYYRDMFPEHSFEMPYDLTCRPNGILNVIDDEDQRGRCYARMIFDDLEEIELNLDKKTVVISPIGYSGKRKNSKNAYQIFGMIFDLDDVGVDELNDLLYQMQNGVLPYATYIVNSGNGVHVVYLFETPLPAMQQYFESLNTLKAALTDRIWNRYTSRDKNKQFQGIFQSFRAVGSPTKFGKDYRLSAYRIGEKTTLHELNSFVEEKDRCIFDDLKYTNINEAEEKWPEWYTRRIVEGRTLGDYKLTDKEKIRRRAWYDAWKERIEKGAHDGNRHYCMGVLFHYARKAEIPLDEALKDAMELLPWLDSLTNREGNDFTEADILAATHYYNDEFIKMGRKGIYRLTKIDIGQTKRNKRSQKDHLQADVLYDRESGKKTANLCKVNREMILQSMREHGQINGRPDKQIIVQQWRAAHPDGKKMDCHKDTGLSRTTIDKWWDAA